MPSRWFLVVRDDTCPECGLEAAAVAVVDLGDAVVEESQRWSELLMSQTRSQALVLRPSASGWSPLEYGGHVRDVLLLFTDRIRLTLATNEPTFEYQDQNEAIVEGRYNNADPIVVAEQILAEARELQSLLEELPSDGWVRWGTRSDDERFDVALLARFVLHEVRHHRLDAERLLQG
jgi:DinB superfamily